MTIDPTKPIETRDGREAKMLGGPSRDGYYFVEFRSITGAWHSQTACLNFLSDHFRNLDPSRLTIEVDGVREEVRCWQCEIGIAKEPHSGFTIRTSDGIAFDVYSTTGKLLPCTDAEEQTFPLTAPRPWLTDEVKQRIAAYISAERKRRKAKADYSRLVTPKGRECRVLKFKENDRSTLFYVFGDWVWAQFGNRLVLQAEDSAKHGESENLTSNDSIPLVPEIGARIDALLDEMEAEPKPVDHHNIVIGGRAAKVYTDDRVPDHWYVHGLGGAMFWATSSGGAGRAGIHEPDLKMAPATRPLPASAVEKIAAMVGEKAVPAVDWKAAAARHHQIAREVETRSTELATAHYTLAALCEREATR